MNQIVAVVLGGGRGTRLQPLTSYRAKPAVPLAGKYRLIDIPLSNCLNSGINQMYVLTQFQSVSLHQHIRGTYRFDAFNGGFVEILAAQQSLAEDGGVEDWYQGTADAVRKNLRHILGTGTEYVLILSGDQLYRMDFAEMLATHEKNDADVTIAAKPVHRSEAHALGLMRVDADGRVAGFLEKPQTDAELNDVALDPGWIDAHGIESRGRDCLANMGIYLFRRDTLVDVLEKTKYHDFGREIFPAAIRTRRVQTHLFDGYWEDIGTIRSFYEANLMLAQPSPPFELASATAPIYSRARFLPPTRCDDVTIERSLVADGCVIGAGTVIENSLVGLRCRIGPDVIIRNSVIMGADYYETADQLAADQREGRPPVGIGARAIIDRAIVDKNCHIGSNAKVTPGDRTTSYGLVGPDCSISDGILIVGKNGVVPEGWHV